MAEVPYARPYKPYPWPWGHPSFLTVAVDERRREAKYWLDADLGEDGDDENSEYCPSESSSTSSGSSGSDSSTGDSDWDTIDDELAYLRTDAESGWRAMSPTPSLKKLEEEDELARQIEQLITAEQDAAAAYNPEEVISLIIQFYELLVTMGHYPEGSIRYPPHTDPPVNEELAAQLGYPEAAISLMRRLPYLTREVNTSDQHEILPRTRLADYTHERDLEEGRHPYPYDDYPDIDPWLLPVVLPGRDGWNIMLDTQLGVVRAYSTRGWLREDSVEWRRHGDVLDSQFDEAGKTQYRRAPLVRAAHYFSELIYAYRSLKRLPIIDADRSEPYREGHSPSYSKWALNLEREEQETLLTLYRECGWPDEWRRAEFIKKWQVKKRDIDARSRAAWEKDYKERFPD
ncbi:hypothetical protein DFH08DRAFT_849739 [Mycena albidolilacea]|uniref:Uncharacterized protein n=1 Tax=Mycena albidolilacea TaxID=1033008 RepID=A0AAD7AEL1_9AGAR|nr:hypothetical protein DFH08DRAFT_849739 [Mycena albidolilacea]